jgi:glutathione-regulated potassium-efflux system ancillary protein KefC
MDFEWIAFALGDVVWIAVAFVMGLLSRAVGLPPLVGFLAAGFLLNVQGITSGEMLETLSDLGITLLLFVVGLKLNLATLGRPQVWAVAGAHMACVVAVFGAGLFGLALLGAPYLGGLALPQAALIAFALSFSSTVFAVKVLEERGEMASLHGRIAIGILIMQDLAAVVFLAVSTGSWPSPWALSVLLLIPLRPVLHHLLVRVGHGELLVLYGLLLALGGAEAFETVGLKGDLGALILGVLMANHVKADELAKTMLGFKDLFLLGFFLSIGMAGQPSAATLVLGVLLTPLIFLKSALFFALFTGFKLRARTAFFSSLNLTNFSEFGLIVAAIGVANSWIDTEWLIALAIAMSLSFAVAAVLNAMTVRLYARHRDVWQRLQRPERLPDDRLLEIGGATIAIIGVGGIGTGTFDRMHELHGDTVVGIDIDPVTVRNQRAAGRHVLLGDPGDADFWDRVQAAHTLELVMLALPNLNTNLAVLEQLRAAGFDGKVAATAKFEDEVDVLREAGATTVFNIYTEAGTGFAAHVLSE